MKKIIFYLILFSLATGKVLAKVEFSLDNKAISFDKKGCFEIKSDGLQIVVDNKIYQ